MTDKRTTPDRPADAIDVVEGPIGSARLRDPAKSRKVGVDLDSLHPIDGQAEESDDTRAIETRTPAPGSRQSTHERQDPDHVGVDWEQTSRDQG